MTFNVVNVTVAADISPADPTGLKGAEGNVIAVPSGTAWPDTNNVPIVPMVVQGTFGDSSLNTPGQTLIKLVASDNFNAGVLTWDFIINIRGMATVNVQQVPVNFASGANQSVWAILTAAGWTPPSMP